jgi:hypothetical protein
MSATSFTVDANGISRILVEYLRPLGDIGDDTTTAGDALRQLLRPEAESLAELQVTDADNIYPGMEIEFGDDFWIPAIIAVQTKPLNEAAEAVKALFDRVRLDLQDRIRCARAAA